jgi:acyl-CoA dehydrogenase
VDFDFSDDQKLLKEQVQRFLKDKSPLSVARRILEGTETHAAEVWSGLADLGALGVAVPEQYGGMGLGALELCVLAEEVGRACAPVPFQSSVCLATNAIVQFGTDAQKTQWLPKLVAGTAIGTIAVSEGRGARLHQPATTFSGDKLSGTKTPVLDGEAATFAIVLAGGAGGPTFALVDLAGSGIKRGRVETLDPSRKEAEISFDGARADILGQRGQGLNQLEKLHQGAAVLAAFEQIGGAEAALYMARDFALERYAFGRQIGSYQAIKHKLADAYIKIELARSNAYYGAMMLSSGGADLALAAAASRVAGIEAYEYAAKENIQTHGGIGFTWAADPQLHYRRSRLHALTLGGATLWRGRLVSALEKRNAV